MHTSLCLGLPLHPLGSPGGTMVKNLPSSARSAGDSGVIPGSGRSLGGGNGHLLQYNPASVFLPGKSHGQKSLVGYSPWGCKKSDMTKQLSTHTSSFKTEAKYYLLLQIHLLISCCVAHISIAMFFQMVL